MSDNTVLPLTGTGDISLIVATDDVGGVEFQRVKLAWGVDGSAVDASASNPLPVTQGTSLPAGSNLVGAFSAAPRTTGGLSVSRVVSAASTNATNVKSAAGQVYGWYLSNLNAAARYVKLYNKATAPTVGTDTPLLTLMVPAGGAANMEFTNGIAFGTGIGFATTTGSADSDTGAVALGDVVVNLLYT
jgi:hypothetical protein